MMLILEILGALLFAVAVVLVGKMAAQTLKNRKAEQREIPRQRREFTEKVEKIIQEEVEARGEEDEPAWEGFRPFFVNRKIQEAEGVVSLYIAPVDQEILPPFRPGQFLTIRIPADKVSGGSKKPERFFVRCYSLSESPYVLNHYRITIKIAGPPSGSSQLPPGLVSSFFNETLKEGDVIEAKAASGQFHMDITQNSPIVLIAGGIGVTPILSMINAVVESGSARKIWFFYGVRNSREHAFKEHLKRIAQENPNFHYQVNYSDPLPGDTQGEDFDEKGRISIDTVKKHIPFGDFDFYICGPAGMMDELIEKLLEWGVPLKNIFYEAFGPSTTKRRELGQTDVGHKITFARSGKTYSWISKGMSLLEFAEAQGIQINFGCRLGNCGTCQTPLIQGNVKMPDNTGFSCREGCFLPCVSIPASDLIIDA